MKASDNVKFGARDISKGKPKQTKPVSSSSGRLFDYEKAQNKNKNARAEEMRLE